MTYKKTGHYPIQDIRIKNAAFVLNKLHAEVNRHMPIHTIEELKDLAISGLSYCANRAAAHGVPLAYHTEKLIGVLANDCVDAFMMLGGGSFDEGVKYIDQMTLTDGSVSVKAEYLQAINQLYNPDQYLS